ncbi:MAG: hypothetical protein ACR2JK_08270 [Geodermatophilaceae bacterium]
MRPDPHLRIEPARPSGDGDRGFATELADPLWMLGRQWRLGEHQGEDSSTPLRIEATVRSVPLGAPEARPAMDPTVVPAEAAIESGVDDWWTYARRVRVGLAALDAGWVAPLDAADRRLLLVDPPPPYDDLAGAPDGLALWRVHRAEAPAWLADVPEPSVGDAWQPDRLTHETEIPSGTGVLAVSAHGGGEVDWWTVDATAAPDVLPETAALSVWPTRFRWPGAPHPRIWQVEDPQTDVGGYPPDRSHLVGTLLVEALSSHTDEWYVFPVRCTAGHVVQLVDVTIVDSFGDAWTGPVVGGVVQPWPPDDADPWSLFRVSGLRRDQLLVWPSAVRPLVGEPVEEVVVSMDEDANLVWAVEQRLDGRAVPASAPEPPPPVLGVDGEPALATPVWRYRPVTDVPTAWHPYTLDPSPDPGDPRRYSQGRLAEVSATGGSELRPLPRAELLGGGQMHRLHPSAVPWAGLRLERRPVVARATSGEPVLWVQRRRAPIVGVPSSNLRLDATDPLPPA